MKYQHGDLEVEDYDWSDPWICPVCGYKPKYDEYPFCVSIAIDDGFFSDVCCSDSCADKWHNNTSY
jgi:hypothetical protein